MALSRIHSKSSYKSDFFVLFELLVSVVCYYCFNLLLSPRLLSIFLLWQYTVSYILFNVLKGIVSRDWGELQMISVDSLELLSIARSYFTYFNKMLKYFASVKSRRFFAPAV